MPTRIMLIGHREESLSFRNLESALASLGELEVVPEEGAMQHIFQHKYDLIVVDASTTEDEALLVSRVRAQRPEARVVVVTASPTWRRARETLQAGAMDYIGKSLSQSELVEVFEDALARKTPPWPQ